jgi:hypothetical protein
VPGRERHASGGPAPVVAGYAREVPEADMEIILTGRIQTVKLACFAGSYRTVSRDLACFGGFTGRFT